MTESTLLSREFHALLIGVDCYRLTSGCWGMSMTSSFLAITSS